LCRPDGGAVDDKRHQYQPWKQRMAVSFSELLDAFTFVGAGAMHEHEAFLCKQSGQIYWHSESGGEFDELPEDIDDAGKYIQIPDKRELGLGKALALEFTVQRLPREFDEAQRIFRKKGAYARFKHLLERTGALEQWYEFEASAQEKALREWCEENSIEVSD
jgi:hypothetical protein